MTFSAAAALFGAMAVLAAIPSVSVLAVTARSVSAGFSHGAMTSLGIVAGDIVLILLAILGLSLLAEAMGPAFFLVKYAGGAYLVWLGAVLWRSGAGAGAGGTAAGRSPTHLSSFMTGVLITLGDQKAILFYLGFFPAFLDLATIGWGDTLLVMVITVVAVGGVKLCYALVADRARSVVSSGLGLVMNRVASAVMIAVGVYLVAGGR